MRQCLRCQGTTVICVAKSLPFRLVADWQVRRVDGREALNDHSDQAYDGAVRARLCAFHHEAVPLVDEVCALAARLREAFEPFVRGDQVEFVAACWQIDAVRR